MRRILYEIVLAIAAVVKPQSFLDLPLERRLMVSSNAISRVW